jgi:hypothetical protein
MKTIELEAEKYSELCRLKSNYPHDKRSSYDGFKSGVQFAQRWIPIEEELPEQVEQLMPLGNRFKSKNVLVKRKWEDTGEIEIEINCRFSPSPRIGFLWNIEYKGSSVIEWRPSDLI